MDFIKLFFGDIRKSLGFRKNYVDFRRKKISCVYKATDVQFGNKLFQNLKVRKTIFTTVCSKLKLDIPTLLWLSAKCGKICVVWASAEILQYISKKSLRSRKISKY